VGFVSKAGVSDGRRTMWKTGTTGTGHRCDGVGLPTLTNDGACTGAGIVMGEGAGDTVRGYIFLICPSSLWTGMALIC